MRKVLLIAYRFPPVIGGGTFRPLKFAKYLPQFGWDPIALCAQPAASDSVDPALLNELPDSVIVERVGFLNHKQIEHCLRFGWTILWKLRLRALARRLEPYKVMEWMAPDSCILWALSAYWVALKLVRQYHPDVVVTTSPPHSIQLLGMWLQGATKLPWVADFRDPWTQNPFIDYRTGWHLEKNKRWEREILERANYVTTVTDMMTEQFRSLDIRCGADKICTITNGFDPSDFAGSVVNTLPDKRLRIAYTGSLYGLRRADLFLTCMNRLVEEGRISAESVSVEFVGPDGTEVLQRYANKSWFRHVPLQSHQNAISSTLAANVLLLLVPFQAGKQIPGKLFDYLRVSRPILALAPLNSEAARVVRAAQAGIVVPPDDPQAISDAILRMYEEWKRGQLYITPDPDVVASFEWRRLTERLVEVLEATMTESAG